jgi:hypothetical protein|tara:strand:+ start:795 stop:968 length:174 start_codon:yes stop_codon:yes gene_type:complete
MADYSVVTHTEDAANLAAVLVLLEAKIETFVNTKTIRMIDVYQQGASLWSYVLIVDA